MKNVYLNSVLLSRFYLQTIQKTKNTTKIIITKISKSKKKNTEIKKGESYLLILLKTTIKTIKNCLRKHRRREDE
jgi:Ni,Fe-hydrogenase I cytochrome b subunit